jgi:hypothetical protein
MVDCETTRLIPFFEFVVLAGDGRNEVPNGLGAFVFTEAGECLPSGAKCILVARKQSVLHTAVGVEVQAMWGAAALLVA